MTTYPPDPLARLTRLTLRRGDTWSYDFPLTWEDDTPLAPAEVEQIWFLVKLTRTAADSAAVITLTYGAGIQWVDTARGKVRVTGDPATTATLAPRRYHYDLQVKLTTGAILTPDGASGDLDLLPDVTRAIT